MHPDQYPDPDAANQPALEALVERHQDFLRFVERRVGSRELAEDILQEAFGRAIGRVDSLREHEAAVAWFYRVLRNAVVDHYRRAAAARKALAALANEVDDPAAGNPRHAGICQCVGRLASALKPEYAAVLQQVAIEGMPVKTFAEQHGITPGNAAVRVFRAREALRRQVIASCGTCAQRGCVDCDCRN